MAKNFSKTQKKRRSVKKQSKKSLSLNNSSKVKVKKKTSTVASVKKKTKSSVVATNVKKSSVKKDLNKNLDLPKLKDKDKESLPVVETVKKEDIKLDKKSDVIETVKKEDKKKNIDLELPKTKEVIEEEKKNIVEEEHLEPFKDIDLPKEVDKKEEVVEEEHLEPFKEDKKDEEVKYVDASYDNEKELKKKKEEEKRKLVENTQVLYNIFVSDYMKQNKKLGKRKVKKIYDYEEDDLEEVDVPRKKSDNVFVNIFYFIKDNLYLLFNTVLGLIFIFLIIGLIEVNVYSTKFIIYVCSLLLFLILVAMSYNKYISGRLLTIVLCLGMSFSIYKLQYNYDFLHSLDHLNYETKTYYIVTFDNNLTKKIYSLSGKKVGILNDNKTNVERKLNIKVGSINYIESPDLESLSKSFYGSEMRAVIVTPNQYKYLSNNEDKYNRKIKILYTFEAVGLK